jgi:hypothetical protein
MSASSGLGADAKATVNTDNVNHPPRLQCAPPPAARVPRRPPGRSAASGRQAATVGCECVGPVWEQWSKLGRGDRQRQRQARGLGRTCVPTVQLPCRTDKEENARPSGKTPHLWVRLNRLLVWLGREGGPQPRWRRLVGIEVGVAMASVSIEAGGRGRGQGKPTAVSTNSRCSGF